MDFQQPSRKSNPLGTGYTNLQQIFQANKTNQLGQAVASGVQQAGQKASGAIQQAGEQYQQGFGQEQQRQAGQYNQIGQILGNLGGTSDQDVSTYQGALSGQSKGPTSLNNADQLRQQAQQAQQLGQATGTEQGRLGLLQNYVGKGGQYNLGQQNLDSLLLGKTGVSQLRQARRGTLGLGSQENSQEVAAQEQGKQLQSGAQNLQQYGIQQAGQAATNYDQAMQQRAKDLAAARTSQVTDILGGDLSNVDQKTYDQLVAAGVGPNRELYNIDLNKYIQANVDPATKYNVQEQADYQKMLNLQKLAGTSLTGDASSTLGNYIGSQPNVGSFASSNIFNNPSNIALDTALRGAQKDYEGKKSDAEKAIEQNTIKLTADYGSPLDSTGMAGSGSHMGGLYADLLNQYNRAQAGPAQIGPDGQPVSSFNEGQYNPDMTKGALTDEHFLPGSQYIQQVYGNVMPQIEEAKQWAANSGTSWGPRVQQMTNIENQLKQAEADKIANDKFYRIGRMLKAPPAAQG